MQYITDNYQGAVQSAIWCRRKPYLVRNRDLAFLGKQAVARAHPGNRVLTYLGNRNRLLAYLGHTSNKPR